MPDGKTHDKITVVGAVAAVPAWWFLTTGSHEWTVGAALFGATLFSGLMLSPDLDLDSSIYRRWGPFRFLWWPYQKAMPHRSKASHSLILGPVLRVLYFLVVGWLLFRVSTWAASYFIHFDRNGITEQYTGEVLGLYRLFPEQTICGGVGLFFGTFLHVAADTIVSGIKRRRHRRH